MERQIWILTAVLTVFCAGTGWLGYRYGVASVDLAAACPAETQRAHDAEAEAMKVADQMIDHSERCATRLHECETRMGF